MARAARISNLDSILDLVLRQAAGFDLRLHLDSRHAAAPAQDQLMNFAWKFMLPMCLVNILWLASGASWVTDGALGGLLRHPW